MNVTYLKDRTFQAIKAKKTEELLPYDLGDELVGALLAANLAEPLDSDQFNDLTEDEKARMREAG